MLKIYNTLSRKKEVFKPREGKKVHMFVCGPTVYDLTHIGHARTYIAFDIIAKYFGVRGFEVDYVQNITDIDDKIINRAAEQKVDAQKLARDVEKTYKDDMASMGITSVNTYARATEHIDAITLQINALIRREFAYVSGGNVYFDITKFPAYGGLSGQKLDNLYKGVRIESDPGKQHPYDFALWKAAKRGEPQWQSPWGPGRPGWHIEDTAITDSTFGPQYDVHGGGIDLIFPHHECEIAQQEGASGKSPMVKYWMHSGHLTVGGTKMSKSLGNFITIRDFLKTWEPEVLRMIVLSAHYRSPMDYTDSVAKQAQEQLRRFREFGRKIVDLRSQVSDKTTDSSKKSSADSLLKKLRETEEKFYKEMDDDLNTPKALAALASFIRATNPLLEKGSLSAKTLDGVWAFFSTIDPMLGFRLFDGIETEIPEEIKELVQKREEARRAKNWQESDRLRAEITAQGYAVEDKPEGPRIRKK